jgi:DNA-binding transcriptional regulator GbsR (MarR family)
VCEKDRSSVRSFFFSIIPVNRALVVFLPLLPTFRSKVVEIKDEIGMLFDVRQGLTINTMDNSGANKMKTSSSRLTPVETEVIEFFVQVARAFNQPRSYAEIYGLLFVSPLPLTQNELEERLRISKGSTSMGLQFLQELGAVRPVKIPDRRRTHYTAVAELRNLAGNFLRQQVSPHLSDSASRLERMGLQAQALTGEARNHAVGRVKLLKSWEKNGKRVLPFLLKVLGAK